METTPKLPDWIRGFPTNKSIERNFKNIYELLPNETKLYGTEALVDENGVPEPTWSYGNWKEAELLLLAQDASNVELIQKRRDIGHHPDPFCAFDWRISTDGDETNRNLHWLAQQIKCTQNCMAAHSLACLSTVVGETHHRKDKE